jgi:dienelactone hydrolase
VEFPSRSPFRLESVKTKTKKPSSRLLVGLGLLITAAPVLPAEPVPHHFTGLTLLPDRAVTLSLDGSVANIFNLTGTISNQFSQMFDLYPVEASVNLADWTPLDLLVRTNNNPSPLLFRDTNAASLGLRFYRTFTNHLLTAFPKPTGTFAVGTADRVMVDPARTNLYRYSPRTNAFMVSFWYPAETPAAGVLPAATWSQQFAADPSFWSFYGLDTRWALIAPRLVGHRFRGVPLAAGSDKLPVVIYSHGLAGTRETSSQIAEELASHGYVVVALDHTDCWGMEFPDGRYLRGSTGGDVTGRLQDLQFLVDELARLNASDALFAGRLNLDRVGVSGISLGGTVVETCRSDSRVKCAAIWEGANLQLNTAGLQKPFLAGVAEATLLSSDNEWLFNQALTNAVLLQVRGANHQTGSDAGWTFEVPWGRAPALAINACFVWFFDTYLKGEAPPFPANPEIYNVQRK